MKIRQAVGTVAVSLGLVMGLAGGVAGAQTADIGETGPDSYNKILQIWERRVTVRNDNRLNADNHNHQYASSGDAKVIHNTTGGSARSGNSSNANTFNVNANVSNTGTSTASGSGSGGSWDADIDETGPDSYNKIVMKNSSRVYVNNDNCISVDNYNSQTAKSGDAMVIDNTTGGSATSGNASNTSNTTVTLRVTN